MKIKEVFKQHTLFKVNDRLCKDIKRFAVDFVNKNPEHIAFFGSGLLGVHRVRWVNSVEENRWFSEICVGDQKELNTALINSGGIDPNNVVGSNVFNLSIIYMCHCIVSDKSLPAKLQEETLIQLISILHFKYIASLITHRFPYGSNLQIAMKLYETLNYKFDLKVFKTWGRLIYERSKSATAKVSIHYLTFMTMRDDEKVSYVATDVQTRIRATINRLTGLYYACRDQDARVVSTSSLMTVEDGIALRDLERENSKTRRYIEEVIPDAPTFIRAQVLETVNEVNGTANPKVVEETLQYISANYLGSKGKKIREFVQTVFDFMIETLTTKGVQTSNLSLVMETIKFNLNGARNKEEKTLWIRDVGDDLVRKATGKKSQMPVSAERTSVVLYIILRALIMNHFK